MDKLSFFGLLIAVVGIIGGQWLEGGSVAMLLQLAAFLIVIGGTLGAVMVQSPRHVFAMGLKMARWAWVTPQLDMPRLATDLIMWSNLARKDGILALEGLIERARDPFVKKGLQLLVDGNSPEKIREVLEVELESFEQIRWQGARVWEAAAGYSPTIGILGAVLGLVHVMESLGEPSKLGAGIAVAFISTIYGVGFANLVFLPIANKLKMLIMQQVKLREMVIDGLGMIAGGEHPRFVENKLQGYLS